MILIDTSAWIEFLRATGSPADRRVGSVVGNDRYAITDPVAAELLAGANSVEQERSVRAVIDSGRFFPVRPLFDYEVAADLYRECRRGGSTPRSLADCLIAAVAIGNNLELLGLDRDLEIIARHSPLRLASV
ncbi:MAG TPA: PIN domain nuclease [Acidimicrobiia bacterium]|nr:PIN domain nuclease [Acidimicrobiia bacterium]